jgi:flavodoxin
MKAAIIYWSKGGNTEKVAMAIQEGLEASGVQVSSLKTSEANDLDWFDYDLVCLGFPSYQRHPPGEVDNYLKNKFGGYRQQGRIKTASPKVPGKYALVFCTYSGPHTGINEAIPAVKYAGQFFDHLGFTVLDEWYVVGKFHGSEEHSTKGRLGDIRDRPNEEDLKKIKADAAQLLKRMLG